MVGTLITRDATLSARLRRLVGDRGELLVLASGREALVHPATALCDLVVIDQDSAPMTTDDLVGLRGRNAAAAVIGLVRSGGESASPSPEGVLVTSAELPDEALRAAMLQAARIGRLERELARFRRRADGHEGAASVAAGEGGLASLAAALRELGKLLAAHFDLERLVDFFLDAVTEISRPGRVTLLLEDEEGHYRIRGQRGLTLGTAADLRLDPAAGLLAWFRERGRLALRAELEHDPAWIDSWRELCRLGGEVAVPLVVHGKLIGILAAGPRVTGHPYGAEDLERLFTLSGQMAVAVEDIALFDTVRAQHGFIEQVLADLGSGAITTDGAGRITRVNRRAAEMVGTPPAEAVGHDLRALPSPLGDLLFDTLRGGRKLEREEVALAGRPGVSLEVSTSRVAGPGDGPAGAVMIIEDPGPRRLLSRERQSSQTLELLNRVLLRLTDEMKNPLVSIYTFLQLLPERYDDPEFRGKFLAVVGKDTEHLVSLLDKLMTLAGEPEYRFELADAGELVREALERLAVRTERPTGSPDAALYFLESAERGDQLTAAVYAPSGQLVVKADRHQLGKAIGYLVRFAQSRVEPAGRLVVQAQPDPADRQRLRLSIVGKPATLTDAEREQVFSPLAIASERLSDVGPGVSLKIVEGHGGHLALGNQAGEVRFTITLPRRSR